MAIYVCNKCGATALRFSFSCQACGEWNALSQSTDQIQRSLGGEQPQVIKDIKPVALTRLKSQIKEFDRIMGGGIVSGTAIIIGGDPGIGKSTIILQVVNKLPAGTIILYVSSEESIHQTKFRAERLNINHPNLHLVSETNVSTIAGYIEQLKPDIVVIDSIQMVYKPEISNAPGTIAQVRESAMDLVYLCKRSGIVLFLVGHITKDGSLAGPKTLEHLVDTVLYFEGDSQSLRTLRAVKNRFGATNEIGIFEMKELGLIEVTNPAELFIPAVQPAGTALVAAMLGSRTFIMEIEALTSATQSAPIRRVSGVDANRAIMVTAVLERRLGIAVSNVDVYVNLVGGMKTDEPAADLGIAMAIFSSYRNKPLPKIVFIGEVGLTGEIRAVANLETRIKEARRMGFKRIIAPRTNLADDDIIKVSYLSEVIDIFEEEKEI